jgi:hypothetical protein
MLKRTLVLAIALSAAFPVLADETAFIGKWKISGAAKAPWEDPAHPIINDGAELYVGEVLEISKGRMTGPDMLGCGATTLSVDAVPYAGLFEGGLAANPKDPAAPYDLERARKLAGELGFAAEPVESLYHGCSEIILHKVNDRTLVFGLDNRIFELVKE